MRSIYIYIHTYTHTYIYIYIYIYDISSLRVKNWCLGVVLLSDTRDVAHIVG